MGTLWTMLLNNLSGHEAQNETIVETEASTNVVCECCSTRYDPNEIEHIENDHHHHFR
jgi:redox-regulated HSP33 family molecular chaperone